MEHRAFMINMIQSELEDAVGVENVSVRPTDQLVYGVDYFWVARMWADKAQEPPKPDFIVRPGSAEEVSKVLKIANYYKIPVQTWDPIPRRVALYKKKCARALLFPVELMLADEGGILACC
jgi:alkyldihydroxyacetonephosphate synthase